MRRGFVLVLAFAAACVPASAPPDTTGPAVTTTVTTEDPGFYLVLMWHQHQPLYPKDAQGVYTRPWVRVHATKDYYDMAAMVEAYPDLDLTFNLTPVLLLQLEDLAAGATDVYRVTAEVPAEELGQDQRRFLLERFFDVNPRIVARFPRFQELADDRAEAGIDAALQRWDDQEYRDLQVLFNLAWTDPGFLEQEPLRALVEKGSGFSEEDKRVVFSEHQRIIGEVIPLHARLWEEGRIELTTTPLAHPILPLLADTSLAARGDPGALLPAERFREVGDADQQVIRGLDVAERLLGRRPVGMWPGEGAVAQEVMSLFSKNGVRWVATGEEVLAQSLGIGSFTRDATDLVTEPGLLYRPWQATLRRNPPVPMFFRDVRLSDQIGFEYSGTGAEAAADDFMRRLRAIRDALDVEAAAQAGRPYVVSVILDGENAWEHYENDGRDFLRALYTRLSEAGWVDTITPTEYLDRFGEPEPLEEVFPASWFQPNLATWIGEEEEATAWEYLHRVRQDLRQAEREASVDAGAVEAAFQSMLFAEGSDWFWWYGGDQDSGDDGYFDRAFRELLGGVYDALGRPRPGFLEVPIIPATPVVADRQPEGLVTIDIDGRAEPAWEEAGAHRAALPGGIGWGFDRDALYLLLGTGVGGRVEVYLSAPEGERTARSLGGELLGFGATHVVVWDGEAAGLCDPAAEYHPEACLPLLAAGGEGIEVAVPLSELGLLQAGDAILARVSDAGRLVPVDGPMAFQVPDISDVAVFLEVADPTGDDHGPGGYTYPTDGVFTAGSYDLERLEVGTEGDELVVAFDVVAPVQNPWGSPRGFSVQTFDLYVDTDPGAGTGARLLIPGRNASLPPGHGWEYALTVEGWDPALYVASEDGSWEETKPSFDVVTFADEGRVVVRLPLDLLGGGDPASWGYAAAVLSQEGFPSPGVRRVRDVEASAQQWRLGGAPADLNHTRIIDVAASEAGVQEAGLSDYPPVTAGSVDVLGPDDFGWVPMLLPGG